MTMLPNNPNILCNDISVLEKEAWLALRRSVNDGFTIGGSEAAIVMGVSPWQTPLDLYKTLRKEPVAFERVMDEDRLAKGHKYEHEIAEKFCRLTGYTLIEDVRMFQHPACPWMIADFDALVQTPDGIFGLEIKWTEASNFSMIKEIKEGHPPIYYEYQCRQYMAVSHLPGWYLAVGTVQGNVADSITDVQYCRIDRDEAIEDDLIERERTFIDDTMVGEEPDITNGNPQKGLDALFRIFGKGNPDTKPIYLGNKYEKAFKKMAEIEEESTALNKRLKEIQDEYDKAALTIGVAVKDGVQGIYEDADTGKNYIFLWKSSCSRRFDSSRFAKDNPATFEAYKKESVSRKPQIEVR